MLAVLSPLFSLSPLFLAPHGAATMKTPMLKEGVRSPPKPIMDKGRWKEQYRQQLFSAVFKQYILLSSLMLPCTNLKEQAPSLFNDS